MPEKWHHTEDDTREEELKPLNHFREKVPEILEKNYEA